MVEDLKLKSQGFGAGLGSTEGAGPAPFLNLLFHRAPLRHHKVACSPSCKIHASLLLVPLTLCSLTVP